MQHKRTSARIRSITIGSKAFHSKVHCPSGPFGNIRLYNGPADSPLAKEGDEFYIEFDLMTPVGREYQGGFRLAYDDSNGMLAALQELTGTFNRDDWGSIAGTAFYVEHDETQGTIRLTDYRGNEEFKLPESSAFRTNFQARKDVPVTPFI